MKQRESIGKHIGVSKEGTAVNGNIHSWTETLDEQSRFTVPLFAVRVPNCQLSPS